MNRLTSLAALLLAVARAAPALALDKNDPVDRDRSDRGRRVSVIDDVIRMTRAGVSDDAIISYVVHTRDRFEVSADDVIALNDAHVSKEVIKAMMDEAADDRRTERRQTTTRTVYVSPYYGYGYGYYDPFYSPYYYNPFWYGPRVSIGVGFGFGHYRRGPFRHGRW